MSTTTLNYTDNISLRRSANIRWMIVLMLGLLLVASVVLVAASSAKLDLSSNVPSNVIAIPNPIVPDAGVQELPEATSTPAPDSVVIAIQAPMPPTDQ